MNKLPVDGHLRTELAEELQRDGYDISSEQLRKYEAYGLFSPEKLENKYRVYNTEVVGRIRRVLTMKMIGLSLKRIKEFLDLKDQIMYSPLIKREPDKTVGSIFAPQVLHLDVITEDRKDEYNQFLKNITKYLSICEEIDDRLNKATKLLDIEQKENKRDKEMALKVSQVK